MAERIARGVFRMAAPVRIESYAAVVGEKEGEGPLGDCFDEVISDSHFGKDTWEQAETQFQLEAVGLALRKAGLQKEDIDVICAGDVRARVADMDVGVQRQGARRAVFRALRSLLDYG